MVAVPAMNAASAPIHRGGARIDVRNVSHRFTFQGAALPVLQDVDFAVEPGEFVALLGPSGCGKSTLLRLVAGLDTPVQGSVHADGAVIEGPDPSRVVVFQDPTLFPGARCGPTSGSVRRRSVASVTGGQSRKPTVPHNASTPPCNWLG